MYNVEKYVERCIRSCAEQDIPSSDYEIIIINDGSEDTSLQIVERVAKEYSNCTVISQDNKGLSAARNAGIKIACGKYYMFVDSDDWIAENCLFTIVRKLSDENPDCMAFCSAEVINGVAYRRQYYSNTYPISGVSFLKTEPPHCVPFSIWKASFLKEYHLTFVQGIFHEDSEFTPRAYYYARKVSFLNNIIYYVYHNPDSITRSINPKKSFDLINVVCENLSAFSNNVRSDERIIYHNLISLLINNALSNILSSNKDQVDRFKVLLYLHKDLFKHLSSSSKIKYRIEGCIFRMLPRNTLSVYKILLRFKFRK